MRTQKLFRTVAVGTALVAAACSSGTETTSAPAAEDTPPGTAAPTLVLQPGTGGDRIGPVGVTLWENDTPVTLTYTSAPREPAPPAGTTFTTDPFRLDATPRLDVTYARMTVPAPDTDPETLIVATVTDGRWVPVATTLDRELDQLNVRVTRFGTFAVLAVPAKKTTTRFNDIVRQIKTPEPDGPPVDCGAETSDAVAATVEGGLLEACGRLTGQGASVRLANRGPFAVEVPLPAGTRSVGQGYAATDPAAAPAAAAVVASAGDRTVVVPVGATVELAVPAGVQVTFDAAVTPRALYWDTVLRTANLTPGGWAAAAKLTAAASGFRGDTLETAMAAAMTDLITASAAEPGSPFTGLDADTITALAGSALIDEATSLDLPPAPTAKVTVRYVPPATKCPDLAFEQQSGDGAFNVTATGISCSDASWLIRDVRFEAPDGATRFNVSGYACTATVHDPEMGLRYTEYRCTRDLITITWHGG